MSKKTELSVSVIVATLNPRPAALARTLAALAAQDLPPDRWELIVVDNGSTPPLAEQVDLDWHPQSRWLVVCTAGKAHALAAGIRASRAGLILVVDDDNVLPTSYLSAGLGIFSTRPRLGGAGGQLIPEFSATPPDALVPHLPMLAIVQFDRPREARDGSVMPPGAGCFFRAELAQKWAQLFERDPIRQQLGSRFGAPVWFQEDIDMCLVVMANNYDLGQFPQLRLMHLIAPARVQLDYLLKLSRNNGAGTLITRWLWEGPTPARARWREWLHYGRLWRLPARDRQFALAYWRGERAALAFMHQHPAYQPVTR